MMMKWKEMIWYENIVKKEEDYGDENENEKEK